MTPVAFWMFTNNVSPWGRATVKLVALTKGLGEGSLTQNEGGGFNWVLPGCVGPDITCCWFVVHPLTPRARMHIRLKSIFIVAMSSVVL